MTRFWKRNHHLNGKIIMSKRIIYIGASNVGRGGRSTIAFNLAQNLGDDYIVDFLCMAEFMEDAYRKQIENKKGRVVSFWEDKKNSTNPIERNRFFYRSMKNGKYDIAHIHVDNAAEFFPRAAICRLAGVKKIIAHGHQAKEDSLKEKIKNRFFQMLMPLICNYVLGCTDEALEHLYSGCKIHKKVIQNGIDYNRYKFDIGVRERVRAENKWVNRVIVGNVGRLDYPKNQKFLLEISEHLIRLDNRYTLLLVGIGKDEKELRRIVKEKNLEKNIIFYGVSDHVEQLLCAMDLFVFPSKFEGFGLAPLEAQFAGLPTFISDTIPDAVMVTSFIKKISLNRSPREWAETIYEQYNTYNLNELRNQTFDYIENSKYNIKNSSQVLAGLYEKLLQ